MRPSQACGHLQWWKLSMQIKKSNNWWRNWLLKGRGLSTRRCTRSPTSCRADLAVLLQPRPKAIKPQPWISDRQYSYKGKSSEKGFGKKGKEKGRGKGGKKGKGKNTWITEMQVHGEWKPLCLKFQLGQCSYPDCKYLHQCAFPRPDGTACGAKHSATEHGSVPH